MTIDLVLADRPIFLGEPVRWISGIYTDEGLGEHHGVKLDSGRWLSVQPNGTYEERDAPQGPYEWFTIDETCNVLRVTPRYVTFALAVREP